MNPERPTIAPDLIAAMIAATPQRVRHRLDRAPDAAASWEWQAGESAWLVQTGGETVTLPRGQILSIEQVRCTCLLAPTCFHVLACITLLQVEIAGSAPGDVEDASEAAPAEVEDMVAVDEEQRRATQDLMSAVGQVLRVGVANTGVVMQSGVLRAIHQCRAEGLHRLAALGLRVIAGTGEFRARAATSDPARLAEDIADVLETSRHVLGRQPVAGYWIGTARRRQAPVHPRKLHGLFAEPILTRSGFAGAAVLFLGEDDRIYSASDVRPGAAERARDAYLGGIEIGPLVQPAKQLARGLYLGTELTASHEGRLGRGKGTRLVEHGPSTWQVELVQKRFRRPLADQWNALSRAAALPDDARPAGWDLVFFDGAVVGAVGAELLFQPTAAPPIRLAIENESKSSYFRENLRMLAHAPGLALQVIARANPQDSGVVFPLAVANRDVSPSEPNLQLQLQIPKSLAGRVCLGFDEIQRAWLVNAQASALVLSGPMATTTSHHPLAALRRRWIAAMLSGAASQGASNANALAADATALDRIGFTTAAALLDALCRSSSNETPIGIDVFLATAVYLRRCTCEVARLGIRI
jgi:hypothetical protein